MEKSAKKAGLTVAAMILATLLSKVLGMLRQMLTAGIFAASMEGIAFSAASKIPFAIFDMLFSAAVLGSFLPIYRGSLVGEPERARRFSSSFFTTIAAITAAISLIGVLFAKEILFLAAPSLDAETARLATILLQIMFPAMIFAGAAYTLVGILQSHEKFILPSLVSALSNLVIISYLLLCRSVTGEKAAVGLALAYLASWLVQFLTLAIPLMRAHWFPKLCADIRNPDLRLSLRRSLPVMFGSWLIPMGTLIANFFSSFLDGTAIDTTAGKGAAIVVFENAFSVFSIVTGLLTYGVCNYIFPKLAEKSAEGDNMGFNRAVRGGIFASIAMILPVAAAVWVLSGEGIRLLYLRGNFTEALASAAAEGLRMLAPAMPFYCVTELLSRAFYSCGKVKYPMYAALAGIAANTLVCVSCFFGGALSVSAIALACTAGQITASLTLGALSLRAFPGISHGVRPGKLLITICAAALSMIGMALVHRFFVQKFIKFTSFENFIVIAIVFLVGIVVYLICMMGIKVFPCNPNRRERRNADAKRKP